MQAAIGGLDAEMQEAEVPTEVNIDQHDIANQLAVVDYIEDIYTFYRKTEVCSIVNMHCFFQGNYWRLKSCLHCNQRMATCFCSEIPWVRRPGPELCATKLHDSAGRYQ